MNWVWFIVGMIAGGCFGVLIMCCLSIHRVNKYEAEISRLRKLIEHK